MPRTIYVINPNRSEIVTQGIDAALAPLRLADGPRIVCLTREDGPSGVQTQCDVDGAAMPLVQRALTLPDDCAAVVIACFSDPGLHAVREAMAPRRVPVFGISESGMLTALSLGQRVGVIAILDTSIPRHMRTYGAMGILDRVAGEKAIGLQVSELSDRALTFERMVAAGRHLVTERGADVLVMGCAGMASFRDDLQTSLGVPVVEPTQAAASMALGRVLLGW
ncbi:Asp/Glu racemase [Pigmentiphaga aceris]|uniref:Asp/Glu racemase n=1 Tax=Pigmentiphaga aceris TaxID=1940612 RepID=A0A5C0AU38_9BURK|nr:aspartate/glutamate racemase family protein [Pigmentiphaga aceris]QEI05892.1 Asp/Glu racemase [Pigmentiphaga aceris]